MGYSVPDPTQEMANWILLMLSSVTVRADDETLQKVIAAKSWLKAIMQGTLIVRPKENP